MMMRRTLLTLAVLFAALLAVLRSHYIKMSVSRLASVWTI